MYLSVDGDSFGFKKEGIHKILPGDIEISEDIYNHFFEQQSQGKQYKVKDPNGSTFQEIFEEIAPVLLPQGPSDMDLLKNSDTFILMELVNTQMQLEQERQMNADLTLQLVIKGVI